MKQFIIISLSLLLAACGFTPLYATDDGVGPVAIDRIDGRGGHALRKALVQRLAIGIPGIDVPATLEVDLVEELDRLALQADESAARTDVNVVARYVLSIDGETIEGRVQAQASFQVPDRPFGDLPAQIDATDRAMSVLARRLVDDLRLKAARRE